MRSVCLVLILALASCTTRAPRQTPTPAAARPSAATAPPAVPSNQELNDRFERDIAERLHGRGDEPAGQVFKNIQLEWLKSVPARRFLVIMNRGYSRALGVNCTHCHVERDFSSDDKRPKRAAREMAIMHRGINTQLRNLRNLELPPDDRSINCFTCHRGTVDPTKASS
ncbi:MAG TPA: photosynthetic reaction center cytochrome c subunit family protein [Thermoanaerobaculia bacterium]|nr:photosynthetic reaction center cytochrome c subunit family protein [Thermoanaerobaculia bacterium]